MNAPQNHIDYPELPLNGRIKLAFNWISHPSVNLLDAGCAWGYGTRFFKKKCNKVFGVDLNEDFIEIAKKRYPDIHFFKSLVENTHFNSNFFDVIILNDVLEHCNDENSLLNELFRILKSKGTLIITLPHKGLFSFMDSENYGYLLKKYMPKLYQLLYRIKAGEDLPQDRPKHKNRHRHYSLKDVIHLLDSSKFHKKYDILNIFRSGLLISILSKNIDLALSIVLNKKLRAALLKPFLLLSRIDYWIPYGIFSYNIALKIQKNKCNY